MTVLSGVFGRYSLRIEDALLEICPYEKTELKKRSARVIFIAFCGAILSSGAVLMANGTDVFTILAMAFVFYIMMREIPAFVFNKMQSDLYIRLPSYLSLVRKKYSALGNIPEAVKEAAREQPREIRLSAEEIYSVLLLGDRREKVREYAGKGKRNRFWKLFMIQAYEASEFGEGSGDREESVFAENLKLLREGIASELYTSKKTAYMFSGYMTVTVLPVIFFGVIRRGGLSFSGEMEKFYNGSGKAVLLAAFLTAFCIYRMISDMGKEKRNMPGHGHKAALRLYGKLEDSRSTACGFIRKLLKGTDSDDNVSDILFKMTLFAVFTFAFGMITDIYKTPFGKIILSVLGLVSGLMPLAELMFRQTGSRRRMVEEIKRMQMVIMMERKLESITVTALLEDIELFAGSFGSVIRECLNMMPTDPRRALRLLKEKGGRKCGYFESIADGFLSVDDVGIKEGFSDTAADRENMTCMEELENMIKTEHRKELTDILAWLPGAVMLGGYFIIPFLKITLSGMEELFELMRSV